MTDFYRYIYPIEQAILAYRQRTQRQPEILVINPKHLTIAQVAIQKVGLSIDIRTSGGCLMGEIWLNIPEKKSGGPTSPIQPLLF